MKIFANGEEKEIEMPTDSNGYVDVKQLRRVIGLKPNRVLIQQDPSGENWILPKRGNVEVRPFSHFMDSPRSERG